MRWSVHRWHVGSREHVLNSSFVTLFWSNDLIRGTGGGGADIERQLIEIFHKHDDNGDGVLDFDEFQTMIASFLSHEVPTHGFSLKIESAFFGANTKPSHSR